LLGCLSLARERGEDIVDSFAQLLGSCERSCGPVQVGRSQARKAPDLVRLQDTCLLRPLEQVAIADEYVRSPPAPPGINRVGEVQARVTAPERQRRNGDGFVHHRMIEAWNPRGKGAFM
jgi:hypothetical protein